jgi:hypothetical protein
LAYYEIAKKIGYTEYEARMVHGIFTKCSRYFIVLEGNVFMVGSKLSSGRSDTLVTNCVSGCITFNYAILRHNPNLDPNVVSRKATTGDDANLTVDPRFFPKDGAWLISAFAEAGWTITSSNKVDALQALHFSEIDYLKRKFKVVGQRVFAPLALESIYRSLAYRVGGNAADEDERNFSAAQSAVAEAFLHGEEFYASFTREVQAAIPSFPDPRPYHKVLEDYDAGLFRTWGTADSTILPLSNNVLFEYPTEPSERARTLIGVQSLSGTGRFNQIRS